MRETCVCSERFVLNSHKSFPLKKRQFPDEIGLIFHERSKEISCRGLDVRLTRKEYQILIALYGNRGYVCPREELLAMVWGKNIFVEPRTIDRHIVKLRRKLKKFDLPNLRIDTVWGIGYSLQISGHH